jgi:hypothetical protein
MWQRLMWQRAVLSGVIVLFAASGVEAAAFVDELYVRYFGRQPFYSELDYWVGRMERRGDPPIVVEAGIIGSPAYFEQNRYNTTRWIRDVFHKVLGRNPSGSELDWWSRRFAQYRGAREEWAMEFLSEMTTSRGIHDTSYAYGGSQGSYRDDFRHRVHYGPRDPYRFDDYGYRDDYGHRNQYGHRGQYRLRDDYGRWGQSEYGRRW